MAEYFDLGKAPETPEERQELLGKREFMDSLIEQQALTQVQAVVVDFLLTTKRYLPSDLKVNHAAELTLADGKTFQTTADVLVVIDEQPVLFVKCSMSSLVSWDRHAVAYCRVGTGKQIPFAVVTDGTDIRLISGLDGSVSEGRLEDIPSREEMLRVLASMTVSCYSEEKCDKERRILYAFDAIRCPVLAEGYPKKPDGQ
ncbi:MAG TPA: hypothetical protein VLH56_07860 [Dissulfurispiraceae bacterium]|nr:hypothetical protein [Dissulfurispiraceae bacterium]